MNLQMNAMLETFDVKRFFATSLPQRGLLKY